ncbi:hypothetical protein ACVIGB_001100 [Bradyrhizobium sp. USDA 4341]
MRIVAEQEIEILGVDGHRLVATFAPDQEALRLRLVNDGSGRTVLLDAEEATRLSEFLEDRVPRGAGRPGALQFANDTSDTIVSFYADNMGEPFREGISISFRPKQDHAVHVFMENGEADRLRKFVADVAQMLQLASPKP